MEKRLETCINLLTVIQAGEEGGLDKNDSKRGREKTDLRHILKINWAGATRWREMPLTEVEENRGVINWGEKKTIKNSILDLLSWRCLCELQTELSSK